MTDNRQMVFIVDDDRSVRTSLSRLLNSAGYRTRVFSSAVEFLQRPQYDGRACLILDVRMPGISGIVLQKQLAREGSRLPIVFLTGHGDLPMGVQAIKRGAEDFLQKPVDDEVLLASVTRAMMRYQSTREEQLDQTRVTVALSSLTPRELETLRLILGGATNREIAGFFQISEKTVKAHRASIMRKTGASTAAELGWICSSADLIPNKV